LCFLVFFVVLKKFRITKNTKNTQRTRSSKIPVLSSPKLVIIFRKRGIVPDLSASHLCQSIKKQNKKYSTFKAVSYSYPAYSVKIGKTACILYFLNFALPTNINEIFPPSYLNYLFFIEMLFADPFSLF
jgi:hypothetical protein